MPLTIDRGLEATVIYSPTCTRCKHLTSIVDRRCKAFASTIPAAIWNGENPHTEPYPGDRGIRFEDAGVA